MNRISRRRSAAFAKTAKVLFADVSRDSAAIARSREPADVCPSRHGTRTARMWQPTLAVHRSTPVAQPRRSCPAPLGGVILSTGLSAERISAGSSMGTVDS